MVLSLESSPLTTPNSAHLRLNLQANDQKIFSVCGITICKKSGLQSQQRHKRAGITTELYYHHMSLEIAYIFKYAHPLPLLHAHRAAAKSENVTEGCRLAPGDILTWFSNRQPCWYADPRVTPLGSPELLHLGQGSPGTSILNEATRLLDEHSISPLLVIESYTHHIHHWLPVIDLHRMTKRLDPSCMAKSDAELASLLLCIYLATQRSSTDIREQTHMQTLYTQSQKIFSLLQTINRFSIDAIQCGILLAIYQIGAGLLPDAYVTLSTTIGLARTTGGYSNHEARVVWWAIFFLDRVLALASLPNNLPLLMEQPRNYGDLPDMQCFRVSSESAENGPYDYFYGEIQAAYLAGQTLQYIKCPNYFEDTYFEDNNTQLMANLGSMFEKAPGSWRPFCSAIALLLTSAIELQFAKLTKNPQDAKATESCLQGVSTLLKITTDITRNYLEDKDVKFANGIVPIASVVSNHHSLVAICRQREIDRIATMEKLDELIVFRDALQKNRELWGLAEDLTGRI
ncbi:hypothetical protein TSTA_124920 [Talaromyces stipitatus ATCC 10500]|uniref:Transcription factor domain-containing protein n=1 Tax=Talaromyces stipitatus (strain ATCC 10500 / CBS 375.48 / QM 6759 / NRRL 1006) TaxID=441959 RepID=B8MCF7_TALSN|nr:uncharacterized protein TSTA_124920 [Talaromyces stipitatus ATCC 10500]EED18773.1 hypothetical protein TSTA_124920 [Talaromyces stipitatus ATCC 10500]